jgi:hypothetical protein
MFTVVVTLNHITEPNFSIGRMESMELGIPTVFLAKAKAYGPEKDTHFVCDLRHPQTNLI